MLIFGGQKVSDEAVGGAAGSRAGPRGVRYLVEHHDIDRAVCEGHVLADGDREPGAVPGALVDPWCFDVEAEDVCRRSPGSV